MEPSGLKRLKKMSEERRNRMVELVEVLQTGLKAIIDAFSKQRRLFQELVELEADKIELMQCNQLSYPQNCVKFNSGSPLSHPPTLEHFCPASS